METLHKFIDASHIYETKAETWFKFMCLAASFFGGLYGLTATHGLAHQYSIAFFIFSIALFMEYILKLISASRAATKAFPLIIILCGIWLFADSIAHWSTDGDGILEFTQLKVVAFIPVLVLFVDTLSITIWEKHVSQTKKPETRVKNFSISEE